MASSNPIPIGRIVNAPDARGRTAFDLIEQAGSVAIVEKTIRAGPQQKQLLQRIQRHIDRSGAGKGAVIIALRSARAPMLLNTGEFMVCAQQDEGEAFIIAQKDVVRRAIALDQLRFEQQRLCLAIGRDNGHAARLRDHTPQTIGQPIHLRIIGHAVLERFSLANIEHIAPGIIHAIDAGLYWQRFDDIADRCDPSLQIRLVSPAHRIGGALFIKAIGGVRRRH